MSNLMLFKVRNLVTIFANNNCYSGLKGLEAVAVTAPGGYELATQSVHKGQRNLRRKYYRRNQRKPKTDENANVVETQGLD